MWISSQYGCCKRRGVIDPRIGRRNKWEGSRQVWSGGGRSGSPDDCREICKDAEREAQTGAASVCLRGQGCQFGWLHVAVYCMHVYLWVSPPRAGDTCTSVCITFAFFKPFGETDINEILLRESDLTLPYLGCEYTVVCDYEEYPVFME